ASCVLLIGIALAPREVQAAKATTPTPFHLSELLALVVVATLLLVAVAPAVWRPALAGAIAITEAAILFAIPLTAWPQRAPVDTRMVSYLSTHLGNGRFFSLGPPGANFGSQAGVRQLDIVDLPVPQAAVAIYRALDPFEDPTVFTGVHGPAVVAPPVPQLFFAHLRSFEDLGVKYVVAPPAIKAFARHRRVDRLVYHDHLFDIWRLDSFRAYVRTPGCTFRTTTDDSYVTQCSTASVLLRDELYFPGWSATVNGRSVKVQDREAFQAVALPKGRSVVALTFLPPRVGLSGVAAAVAAGSLLVPYGAIAARRRRRTARRRDDASPPDQPGDDHPGALGEATDGREAVRADEVAPAPPTGPVETVAAPVPAAVPGPGGADVDVAGNAGLLAPTATALEEPTAVEDTAPEATT
ncbi:MAG TPA: hypothetical protein VKT18_10520, partial [Acidimicrobiales bacterium]|nr:hypothetical protein [Acidimicrobiales bacterium]